MARRRRRDERGSTLVEFALILPIFMMLVLGMFSGGVSYHRKLSITHASREASRYAATLPVTGYPSLNAWLDAVAQFTVDSASDELDPGDSGRVLCVAYVHPNGTLALDRTTRRDQVGAAAPSYSAGSGTVGCFADGRPEGERRVHVVATRSSQLQALVFSRTIALDARAAARFEVNG